MKIALVSWTLKKEGYTVSERIFDCVETEKLFVIKVGSIFSKRIKRDRINTVFTKANNSSSFITYSVWCHQDEIIEQSRLVLEKVVNEAKQFKSNIEELLKHINE